MKAKLVSLFLATLTSLFISTSVFAQATGGMAGTVTDQNGAIVQGANITVKNTATNLTRNTTTNDDGRWTLTLLPVGNYSVTYEKEGFKKSVSQNTAVEASVTRSVEVALEVGAADVFVDVTTDQPLVQAESAAVSRQITGEQLTRTPTSVTKLYRPAQCEAGVSTELSPVGVNGNGNISPSVNGTRTTSTSLFFNGIDATNITSNEGSLDR